MNARLVTLEGDHSRDGLFIFPHEVEEGYTLLGDTNSDRRFKVSLAGDYIEELRYSPIIRNYTANNDGVKEASQTWIPGNNGYYWHTDEQGNLLGCSVCIADETLAGEEIETYYHFNIDGSLAGYTLPKEDDSFVTLAGVDELGFFKGKGFKMPSFKASFKMPKLSLPKISLPKFKIPKISIPKLSIPKINIPKFKLPDVGKSLSKIGNKIGNAVDTHVRKVGEAVNAAGNIVSDIAQGAAQFATGLLPGMSSQGMAQEQPQEEEQPSDYTQPGYEDDKGYTASDGNYYLHDGTMYLDNQTGQWVDMQQSQAITDYTQPGYEDEKGYTASDGNYYLHDGSQYLNNQTGEWVSNPDVLYGVELGFDFSSLSSLASNPMVSMGLNAVLPGAGAALPMISSMLPGMSPSRPSGSSMPLQKRAVAIRQPPARPSNLIQTTIRQPPVRQASGSSSLTATNTRGLLDMIPGWQGMVPPIQPAQPPAPLPKDDNKMLMIGGGIVALGLIYVMTQNKPRGRR